MRPPRELAINVSNNAAGERKLKVKSQQRGRPYLQDAPVNSVLTNLVQRLQPHRPDPILTLQCPVTVIFWPVRGPTSARAAFGRRSWKNGTRSVTTYLANQRNVLQGIRCRCVRQIGSPQQTVSTWVVPLTTDYTSPPPPSSFSLLFLVARLLLLAVAQPLVGSNDILPPLSLGCLFLAAAGWRRRRS